MKKLNNNYIIEFNDKSFMIVDNNYILNLFHKKDLNKSKLISIEKYLKYKYLYKNYVFCDYIFDKYKKTSFIINEYNNIKNYPLNTRLKKIQDIQIGDLVEGRDNKPRVVKKLHSGLDEMYEIIVNGESHIVNSNHILRLKSKSNNEEVNIPLNVYLHMSDEFKEDMLMIKEGG